MKTSQIPTIKITIQAITIPATAPPERAFPVPCSIHELITFVSVN